MVKNMTHYFYAIFHLKLLQIVYRILYLLKSENTKKKKIKLSPPKTRPIILVASINSLSLYVAKKTFSFLNYTHNFNMKINWDYAGYGMLWTYNLNYFEYLHQNTIDKEMGLSLMHDYLNQYKDLHVGYNSYPISLRNIFWIRFIVTNKIKDDRINAFLYDTYVILSRNLEYHLLGNHLLENAFSLLFGAYYFRDAMFYRKAYRLLKTELTEQILNDGGHFELSPMYHKILLYRLLDCYNIVLNNEWVEDDLLEFMHSKCSIMLSWLKNMTFPSENTPSLNDASDGIAPSSIELFSYAERLAIAHAFTPLSDSNYRLFKNSKYSLICDIDGISPAYQCGHAHADTFNFVMEVDGQPFFVDTGCSTYQIGETRTLERGTSSHNTVMVNGGNSSQVWASHRVGRRAKVTVLEDTEYCLKAQHNGYKGMIHCRSFSPKDNCVEIVDKIIDKKRRSKNVALYHLDYSVEVINKNPYTIANLEKQIAIKIEFTGAVDINISEYKQAIGFNNSVNAKCICVIFNEQLKTTITV